jgi:hypothetical protein
MLRSFRTYRLLPAMLAAVLMMSVAVPLMQHVCAMGGVSLLAGPDCCCDHESQPPADDRPPCHGEAAAELVAPNEAAGAEMACCSKSPAQAFADGVTAPHSPAPLASASRLPDETGVPVMRLLAAPAHGPPATPLPLHVLYASFLI